MSTTLKYAHGSMLPVDIFKLVPNADDEGTSSLWANGQELNGQIPGVSLEAQYLAGAEGEGPYLLLTTYDVPHEETLHVLLVDMKGGIVESTALEAPYLPGILENLRLADTDSLRFDFQGPVLLKVHAKPRGLLRRRIQVQRLTAGE